MIIRTKTEFIKGKMKEAFLKPDLRTANQDGFWKVELEMPLEKREQFPKE